MVEKISEGAPKDFETAVSELTDTKKQLRKSFLGNAGIIIGVFLIFVVMTVSLTDISITTIDDVSKLAVRYTVILFVSYQMYVNTADSGSKRGLLNQAYIDSEAVYLRLKKEIIDGDHQAKLPGWCADYIKRELVHTRTVIVANIGMSYDELLPYLAKGEEAVKTDPKLSKIQKKTICKAITVKPVKLTPAMIMSKDGLGNRSPLGLNPRTKRNIMFGWKLATSSMVTAFIVLVAFEVIFNPTADTIVYMVASVLPVILNGVGGYVFGYENIVYDTSEYMGAQSAVIKQFLKEICDGDKDCRTDEKGV